jgi:hypothetical protein
LEERGVDAPGLDVAQEKIQQNIARAARILEEQRARGREVAQLAKRLDDKFDAHQDSLKEVFDVQKETLKAQAREIRLAIGEARRAGNFTGVAELRAALEDIRLQKEMLDAREDLLEEMLEAEEARIEAELEAKEKELEALAEEAEDLFDQRENDLERAFEQKERELELQEIELEIRLRQALRAGDLDLAAQLKTQLLDLERQEQALEREKELAELALEQEEEELTKIMELPKRAEQQIANATAEIAYIEGELDEMLEEGIITEVPRAVLELVEGAERKLAAAEQAFEEGNYGKAFGQAMAAEMLARNARRILWIRVEVAEKLEELKRALTEAGRPEAALEDANERLDQATEEERARPRATSLHS